MNIRVSEKDAGSEHVIISNRFGVPQSALAPQSAAESSGGQRVLIAEDEVDLAWVERFNLEAEGYEVEWAEEGRQALAVLESFGPDLLILDVMLPYVDGWSVLAWLREWPAERRPKVIVVSAATGLADQERALTLGARSFLPKPFDMDDLLELVATTLAT
jgi:DNA-binding response OmpR family regulator